MLLPSDAPVDAQEAENQLAGLGGVNLAVGLFLGPAGPGDEEHLGVRADRLRTLCRSAEAADGGANLRKVNGDLLDLSRSGFTGKGSVRACVEQQEPGARVAAENGLDALAIEPAGCFDGFSSAESGDVRVDEAAETVRHSGCDAREARGAGSEDDCGLRGAADCFDGGGVGGVTRLGEGLAGDGEQTRSRGRQTFGQVRCIRGHDADGERSFEPSGQLQARSDGFERGLAECGAGFVCMSQNKYCFHHSAPIHSTSSAAISSGVTSFTTRVVRCCLGRLTET